MGKGGVVIFSIAIILMLASFSSAGVLDWFGKITGKATSQNTNVTVTISGSNAVTIEVFNNTLTGAAVDPSADTTKAIAVIVRVNDSDGYLDINTTSVTVNFSRSGEVARINNSCTDLSQSTTYSRNFSCTVDMWYYDDASVWTINVAAKDLGNMTLIVNSSTVFTFGSLQSIRLSPSSVTFPSSAQGAVNITSNNDPTLINNSGNFNFTFINITAYNLYGETTTSEFINVANITVGNNTNGANAGPECDVSPALGANATILSNGTQVNVKHSILTRGNHSINNNQTGQEQTFYCFRTIPTGITSQTYSSGYIGGWVVWANP